MFLVIQSAISRGKKYAYFASAGIIVGTIVWLIVGFFFIKALSKTSFFEIVQIAGGCYLLYMSWQIFKSLKRSNPHTSDQALLQSSPWKGLMQGIFTNLSNPKPPIFVSIILSKIPQTLTFEISLLLLCIMVLIPSIWFPFVVRIFTIKRFFQAFMRYSKWIDLIVLSIFCLFGLSLILDGIQALMA